MAIDLTISHMKVSVYIATSIDGFIARGNGDLDWLPGSAGEEVESDSSKDVDNPEPDIEDMGYADFMKSVDALVMGRNTYQKVLTFGDWPYGEKNVTILSSKIDTLATDLPESVELRNCSVQELYTELKAGGKQHVYVDGANTIQRFLNAGLINEIIITKIPVLIGGGIPLFGKLENDVNLKLIYSKSQKKGFVQSKYLVLKSKK